MTQNSKRAKVFVKVPCPDQMVHVRVYPPDSLMDVKVSPEGLALEIRVLPRGRTVEVQVTPAPDDADEDGCSESPADGGRPPGEAGGGPGGTAAAPPDATFNGVAAADIDEDIDLSGLDPGDSASREADSFREAFGSSYGGGPRKPDGDRRPSASFTAETPPKEDSSFPLAEAPLATDAPAGTPSDSGRRNGPHRIIDVAQTAEDVSQLLDDAARSFIEDSPEPQAEEDPAVEVVAVLEGGRLSGSGAALVVDGGEGLEHPHTLLGDVLDADARAFIRDSPEPPLEEDPVTEVTSELAGSAAPSGETPVAEGEGEGAELPGAPDGDVNLDADARAFIEDAPGPPAEEAPAIEVIPDLEALSPSAAESVPADAAGQDPVQAPASDDAVAAADSAHEAPETVEAPEDPESSEPSAAAGSPDALEVSGVPESPESPEDPEASQSPDVPEPSETFEASEPSETFGASEPSEASVASEAALEAAPAVDPEAEAQAKVLSRLLVETHNDIQEVIEADEEEVGGTFMDFLPEGGQPAAPVVEIPETPGPVDIPGVDMPGPSEPWGSSARAAVSEAMAGLEASEAEQASRPPRKTVISLDDYAEDAADPGLAAAGRKAKGPVLAEISAHISDFDPDLDAPSDDDGNSGADGEAMAFTVESGSLAGAPVRHGQDVPASGPPAASEAEPVRESGAESMPAAGVAHGTETEPLPEAGTGAAAETESDPEGESPPVLVTELPGMSFAGNAPRTPVQPQASQSLVELVELAGLDDLDDSPSVAAAAAFDAQPVGALEDLDAEPETEPGDVQVAADHAESPADVAGDDETAASSASAQEVVPEEAEDAAPAEDTASAEDAAPGYLPDAVAVGGLEAEPEIAPEAFDEAEREFEAHIVEDAQAGHPEASSPVGLDDGGAVAADELDLSPVQAQGDTFTDGPAGPLSGILGAGHEAAESAAQEHQAAGDASGTYGSGYATESDVAGDASGSDGSGYATESDVAGEAPVSDGSGEAPGSDGSGDAPESDVAGEAPGSDFAGDAPESDFAGDAPAVGTTSGPPVPEADRISVLQAASEAISGQESPEPEVSPWAEAPARRPAGQAPDAGQSGTRSDYLESNTDYVGADAASIEGAAPPGGEAPPFELRPAGSTLETPYAAADDGRRNQPETSTAVIVNYLDDRDDGMFAADPDAGELGAEDDLDIDLLEVPATAPFLAKPMIPVPKAPR
ncbi:MAG: hypothetical protein LBR80_14630 [Deltaproteobacteria bacterium]|jgi:hypothetical protein|nr:hypothetical protein [Deltaproteobacteria bacterium]